MSDLTAAHTDKLMADLRVMIADAEALLKMTAEHAGEGAAEVRGRVQQRLAQAKADLLNLEQVAVAKARAAGQAADQFVHENPWKSMGVAAGVGLLIGLLVGRR